MSAAPADSGPPRPGSPAPRPAGPAAWTPLIDALCARMPVVLATRTGAGPVLSHTYGRSSDHGQDLTTRTSTRRPQARS